jgi:hypothetical protein
MRKLVLLVLLASAPAQAEIKASSPSGFEVERKAFVLATPEAVFAQIGRVAEWWDPVHSYSGKAAGLRLELRAGGCFCENIGPGASVEHMRVIYADPKVGIRLSGALGPLQKEAVTGTLSWSFKELGSGTEVTQNYIVTGFARGGIQSFAVPVDKVLSEQFDRLVTKLAAK